MSNLSSRVVVVTGGSKGIGRTIVEMFHSRGDRVAVCSRSATQAGLPPEILCQDVDVRRQQEIRRFVASVRERFGLLDVWVNCAGISRWRPIEAIDQEFTSEVIETGVLGTLFGCAAAVSALREGGTIINLSSLAGKRGSANNSAYCAAKFAVNGMTQSLAKELGPRGIRVNAVCPVYVRTEQILSSLSESASPAQGRSAEAYLSSFESTQTALGRLPTTQEVSEVVYFLASPAASAVSGQCINVDCGTLPQ